MPIAEQYRKICARKGKREANLWLLDLEEQLPAHVYDIASNEDTLRLVAKRRAEACGRLAANKPLPRAYKALSDYARALGILPPRVKRRVTLEGVIRRLRDEQWWRLQLRKTCGRQVERFAIRIGRVHKRAGIYASDESVARRQQNKARNRDLLESLIAVNELGQEYTLQQLADLSVSNPHVRRSELMARIAGFEQVAEKLCHEAVFLTVTCPSRMHARRAKSGDENPTYDGTTPRDAQQYLNRQWRKIRAALHRRGIRPYGFRIAEPHHDGTPHWHLLLFIDPEHLDKLCDICRRYALEVDGDEPGADRRRFQCEHIDRSKGSAAGYVIKYISKNIDGHGLDKDLYGYDAKAGATRIDAWASTWGIRQFQQIGGPPVTVYRELRRTSAETTGLLEAARRAADAGDWAGFVEAMGGPQVDRKSAPIRLVAAYNGKLGAYGEPLGEQVYGVQAGSLVIPTRIHEWRIKERPPLETAPGHSPEASLGDSSGAHGESHGTSAPCLTGPAPLHRDNLGDMPCYNGAQARSENPGSVANTPLEFCQ